MRLFYKLTSLFAQFVGNLSEADWASRHLADEGPGLSDNAEYLSKDSSVSGLSLALHHMGLVRPLGESPMQAPTSRG